jgi:glucose-1-phosphate adenylyltransferase
MSEPKILAFVMAGGEGKRLYPLTSERSKPSVPFGGRYRLVDFALSNLMNSGIFSIYLLVQYKSQSLIEHVRKSWSVSHLVPGHFVTVVPPQMRGGPEWFQGTADAVYQNLNLIGQNRSDIVAIFGADHIYRMDVRQMARFHIENEADVTVAAVPVPASQCSAFGVVVTDSDSRIKGFAEKPDTPITIPGNPEFCYGSMGNYLFNTAVLLQVLEQVHNAHGKDFGHDVLPKMTESHRVFAYDFTSNRVPGTKPYEDQSYWRDVGTIDAYFAAHRDLLGLEPKFDEFNLQWPIYSGKYLGPAAKMIGGTVENSRVAAGSVINNATVRNSIIGREVTLQQGTVIEDSVVMDYTVIGKGTRLRKVIVDRYNTIPPDIRIGYNHDDDRQHYHVTESGIVVVPQGPRGSNLVYETG